LKRSGRGDRKFEVRKVKVNNVDQNGEKQNRQMSYESKLKELGLTLPAPPKPMATYVPAVRAGDLLFLSGVLPLRDGQLVITGKLGAALSIEQGMEAAKVAVLNALAIIRSEVGSLDRVKHIVKMVGYIASAPGFSEQPQVLNGASDLLIAIFGEAGRHARVAVGAAELPRQAPVEIELIAQIAS
jgi:enamine deaminase RidA (YjgF/YER057c/UK114 family)